MKQPVSNFGGHIMKHPKMTINGLMKQPVSNDYRYIYIDFGGKHFMKQAGWFHETGSLRFMRAFHENEWFDETACFKWVKIGID